MAAEVGVAGIRKTYGDVVAVDNVDLNVNAGEFFTLLGPSGSGKTTTLRMIAGFEQPDAGTITLGGEDITRVPPYSRDVNTVFQDYALFPHMTVAENVGYGLKVKGIGRRERSQQVEEVLRMVRLDGYGGRKPVQLSGGQRQRVALARSIVNRPKVLLLDEPLGALDLKLRQEMQVFLKALQRDLGMTFLYVTHDQEEALTMSDHVAVFNAGRIEQVGTPAEVYERPATEFVAGFVGTSNILERNGRRFTIRPEKVRLLDGDRTEGEPGHIRDVVYLGAMTRYVVQLDGGGELVALQQNVEESSVEALEQRGKRVRLDWRKEHTFAIEDPVLAPLEGGRNVKRIRRVHLLVLPLLAALVVPAVAVSRGGGSSGLPTSIGKGEGSLNLIEWSAYSDPSFAKKFEQQTGCTIHRKDAGTSNEMVALMRSGGGGGGGQYDLVSASGDASLRLIYGGDLQPVNVNLIPTWKDFLPAFKSPAHNTVKGVHYGISVQWGPNTLLYNTKKVSPAPTGWSSIYSGKYKGKLTVPNNPIQIADAALYLEKTKPSLGIKDPYELTKAQLDAATSLLKQQKPLLKRYWNYATDEITSFKNGDVWMGAGWPYQTLQLQGAKAPIKEIVPLPTTGWADTWMLAQEGAASELCVHVDEVRDDSRRRGEAGARLR